MHEDSRLLAQRIWRQLAARNQWQLFSDEELLLGQVLTYLTEIQGAISEGAIRNSIQACYSARLYQGLQQHEERAAYELWLMFLRLAMKKGATESDANDLAQECMARVLIKLAQVRLPERFLAWAMKVFATALRDMYKHPIESSLAVAQDAYGGDPPDLTNMLAEIEEHILEDMFSILLQDALPNKLERLVIIRHILMQDKLHEIADDLHVPQPRIRLAKSRALQRLRNNTSFMQLNAHEIYSLQ